MKKKVLLFAAGVSLVILSSSVAFAADEANSGFLTNQNLDRPFIAADCAQYLRSPFINDSVFAVSKNMLNPDENEIAKVILRMTAGLPVYGGIRFTECEDTPMLSDGMTVHYQTNYNLHGYVTSDAPLTKITATITHSERNGTLYPAVATVEFSPEDNVTFYDLNENLPDGSEGINAQLNPCGLRYGEQTIVLTAQSTKETEPVELVNATYNVEYSRNWLQLREDNFSDNYHNALNFFQGDKERFLFQYRWRGAGSNRIVLDPEWRNKYLVKDEWGSVHVDAQPYFNKARDYINHTYFRVRGFDTGKTKKEYDTGVQRLSALVLKNSGTCIARFVSNKKYISHHSFGTVVDLNTNLNENSQWVRNKPIIYHAVKHCLTYNGIKTDENGTEYYDFYYEGDYKNKVKNIPPAIVNYLLYELAFYRAGFRWGFYFDKSDAMHFTLTESDPCYFENGIYALRKVYTYIDE